VLLWLKRPRKTRFSGQFAKLLRCGGQYGF